MSYIYLGSPYSHKNPNVRLSRFRKAQKAMVYLMSQDKTVYSPIVQFHELALAYILPKEFDFWKEHNYNMIRHAKSFAVLDLGGTTVENSKGLQAEIRFARQLNIPVSILPWNIVSNYHKRALTQILRNPTYGQEKA